MNANPTTIPLAYELGALAGLPCDAEISIRSRLDNLEGHHRLTLRARSAGMIAVKYLHPKGQEFRAMIDTAANRFETQDEPMTWEQDLFAERVQGFADCLLLRVAQLFDQVRHLSM